MCVMCECKLDMLLSFHTILKKVKIVKCWKGFYGIFKGACSSTYIKKIWKGKNSKKKKKPGQSIGSGPTYTSSKIIKKKKSNSSSDIFCYSTLTAINIVP